MKKLLFGTILFILVSVFPVMTMADVDISIGISLPPLILFAAPPNVVVLPDTNSVYVVPDIAVDLFFWNGWWWRPWEGGWYRSRYYDRGWSYYNKVPRFYFDVDPGWRGYYRDRNWYGHRWDYERIPHQRLHQNWKSWHNTRHWERQRTWGVQNYQPRPQQQRQELRYQRRDQYQQRPEVQRYQQQIQKQQRQPQVQQRQQQRQYQQRPEMQQPRQQRPEQQKQPQVQQHQQQRQYQQKPEMQQRQQQKPAHSQPRGQQYREESQHQQFQGKPGGGDSEHRK